MLYRDDDSGGNVATVPTIPALRGGAKRNANVAAGRSLKNAAQA
jgi:hypothetical protein